MFSLRRLLAEVRFDADAGTAAWVLDRLRPYLDSIGVIDMSESKPFTGWHVYAGDEAEQATHGFSKVERRYSSGEHCTFLVHAPERIVMVQHPIAAWRRLYALRIIRNALRWELFREGALFLHGSSVSLNDRGICIIGPRFSGKSFLSYSLLRQGRWDFVTQDDVCLVNDLTKGWKLLGWPGCLRLRLSGRDAFAELRAGHGKYEHPANPLEACLPPDVGMFRMFPEELQRNLGSLIRAECVPKVLIVLAPELPRTFFRPLDGGELLSNLRRAWDVLPERRAGASSEEALLGLRPWQDIVFDSFFLNSFRFPSMAIETAMLAHFSSSVGGFIAGREALLDPEFAEIVRSHL